jgi:hypothetical protein
LTLDLDELLEGWVQPRDEVPARVIAGLGNELLIQLRVDMGLVQMFPDGRPDGQCYCGCTTALDFFRQQLRDATSPPDLDWSVLARELQQFNYRRLALMSLIEEASTHQDVNAARVQLRRAIRDIDHCLTIFALTDEHSEHGPGSAVALIPALIFHRARLLALLREAEERVDDAIEELKAGATALDDMLARMGVEEPARARDPGVAHLRKLEKRLRSRHGVEQTLREQLEQALELDQFERAAHLRDELRRRARNPGLRLAPPPDDSSTS